MTIDQELQKALDVDPSPEFLARVRSQIASEPVPQRWGLSWIFATAVAAAVALIVVGIFVAQPFPGRDQRARDIALARGPQRPALQPARPSEPAPVSESTPGGLRYSDRVHHLPNAAAQAFRVASEIQPEIVVDQREAAALRGLLKTGTLRAEEGFSLTPVEQIQIAPLNIAPLETAGEGVRQ